ncbi:EPIDERMAL PATTERNING FACTOR-like protein 2 [Corylus avellana]|uniref:EPIDERMAL PATTERNING FACTOR-like protein 2 n=1 Tax=Corylus avellana TaxID=13451 RepID=UPI00286BE4F5|nr:EPIDERMAL PATTERNING FACTOR-like protein 2 [Corylus avellana]
MGSSQNCIFCHRSRHLLIFLLSLLLLSSLNQLRFMAEGRGIPKLVDQPAQKGIEEMEVARMVRTQIGSRPPRCERRCSHCGHCEAVQVPIATQVKTQSQRRSHFSAAYSSRGDDISNYKPMCWKCKCGDLIFNP